ncbi:MAG TPA: 16S rRNA (guanine(527)-N(7))-methyltransferase RsmG [Nitrospirae bacterium]|nr:16S rRNA (guanine(527)-N(7))-methyltransferase RsmG [Nitrospirota bacterium]
MKPKDLLKHGLKELGISCSNEQLNTFMTYLLELKKWNRVHNLTALKADKDIILKHFLDSLLYLKAIRKGNKTIADAGSGAGFPGIPIKIIKPEVKLILIESSGKKCTFLRHIIRTLKIKNAEVLNKRIEALGEEYEKTFDIVVSRATFKITDFMDKACPYLKEKGYLVISKGPGISKEISELTRANNGEYPDFITGETLKIPISGDIRNILCIRCNL